MDKNHSDSIRFNYITFDQIGKIKELHPLVYENYLDENQKFTKFDYLESCPDIRNNFPCFFYLTDQDKIISTLSALPDEIHASGEIFSWAWAGALFTDPYYRGKGLATLLIKNMVKVLHKRNIGWGGVFSTLEAIHIYRKLNFVIPGYANRYLLLKTAAPLGNIVKNKMFISVLDIPYRITLRIILKLINRPLPPNKFNIAVRKVDIANEDLSGIPRPYYHTPYHFNDNFDKIKWKILTTSDTVLYFIISKSTNKYLCYFVLKDRNRKTKDPFSDRFFNVKLMTLMDYGVYNNDINTYEALVSAVFSLFWDGDAEALEVISSSKILNKILKRNGMVKVFKGMSFKFCAPQSWKVNQSAAVVSNWPLTHFNGDGFMFR
mgnify:CR=1 FL=1